MASVARRPDGRWRARFRGPDGRERARHFARKVDAQRWLDQETTATVSGTWVTPEQARMTLAEWCETWLSGYSTRRASTVRQARVHVARIVADLGSMPLGSLRPSHVRSWCAGLKESGYADSTVYAFYARLSQILADAVHDGLLARSPCSRRTSPGMGEQRPYVATTAQVWAIHDAFPENLRPAWLLGAFVGLRTAEAVALRVGDVDFLRGVVTPAVQYPAEPLKSETSRTPVPIPRELTLLLSQAVARWPADTVVTNGRGGQSSPWAVDRAMRAARRRVAGLPEGFRFHDGRHYLASLLIAAGADVKVVQRRLRHASATTTLNVYAHLWPDADTSTRAAIGAVIAARVEDRADSVRTSG